MTSPRNIAVVCHPSLGGSGIVATELALGLARRGHRVHVITSGTLDRPLPECPNLRLHAVHSPAYPLFDKAPDMLAVACKIAEICSKHAIDLLHVHYAVPHASSAYLARQLLGANAPALVTTLHGTDVTMVGIDPAYHAITRMAVESSDAITTPSEFLRREAHRLLAITPARDIDVIANCVDTERFTPVDTPDPRHFDELFAASPPQPLPTLLHVSNFRAVKRTQDLIDVFARVNDRVPTRLLLIGDGPERAASQARSDALGLGQSVRFVGARTSVSEHLPHAAAFVLTSETESFGLAALEALSCGVPVFAYRVGGLPAVVTDDVGELAPPFDSDALAEAVARVLSDPSRRAELGHAARRHTLDHFQLAPALARYEQLFERVCAAKVRRHA